jgi:predicted transposase/invertase (TIGR01784 family)
LDFVFEEDKTERKKYRYNVKLTDIDTCKVFYDKLTFIYLEMPKFNKSVEELETRFEKWLYVLRNLNKLDRIPERLRERIFERLFEVAEVAKFTREELLSYEDSLKYYRDLKNSLDTAFEEGKMEGEVSKAIEVIKKGHSEGLSIEVLSKLTGVVESEVKRILNKD